MNPPECNTAFPEHVLVELLNPNAYHSVLTNSSLEQELDSRKPVKGADDLGIVLNQGCWRHLRYGK